MIEPRKELNNIKVYETPAYPENWDMKLDSNENYIGPSALVMDAIRNIPSSSASHYPYYGSVFDKLAQYFDIPKNHIAITNGADEALCSVLNTYLTKEDAVLTASPSFSMPKLYASLIGAEYIEIPYTTKWEYPLNEIKAAISDRVKIVLITTPNNPTGDIVCTESILELIEAYPDKCFVIDETYSSFSDVSNIKLVRSYDNVVVVRSFSKDFALAGLRFGCVISAPQNIENIKKLLSPYNVNSIAVTAVEAALDDKNYIKFVKDEIKNSKEYLTDELSKLGVKCYDSYANFLLADFGNRCDVLYEKLKFNKIIVKKFKDSEELKGCLRITLPTAAAAKKIIDVISSRDTLVFDMDGVLVDVSDSYYAAVKYTYQYFTGKELSDEEIKTAKNQGGLNNDWDLTAHLIEKYGFNFAYEDIVTVFQQHYWNDGNGSINNETLLIDPKLLAYLAEKYNIALFTGRPREEALYTLKKFDLDRYFSVMVTMNDLSKSQQKPHPQGLNIIKDAFFTSRLIYFGDTVDDAKCAADFGAYGVGVLPPSDKTEDYKKLLLENGDNDVIDNINNLKIVLEKLSDEI